MNYFFCKTTPALLFGFSLIFSQDTPQDLSGANTTTLSNSTCLINIDTLSLQKEGSAEQLENTSRDLGSEFEEAAKEDPKSIPHVPSETENEAFTHSNSEESKQNVSSTPKTLVPGPWRSNLGLIGSFNGTSYDHSFDDFHDGLSDIVDRCIKKIHKIPRLKDKNAASLGISFVTKTKNILLTESRRCFHPTDGAYVFVSGAKAEPLLNAETKRKQKSATSDEESPIALRNMKTRTPAKQGDGRSSLNLQQSRVKGLLKQTAESTASPQSSLSKEAMEKTNKTMHQGYFGINGLFPEFFLSHTEQIIIQYLDENLETLVKNYQDELDLYNHEKANKKELVGVYINIHTYRAVCKTCRATLIRAIESPTRGMGKLLAEQKERNPNFKTGMLVSSTINHQGAHSTDHDTYYHKLSTVDDLESVRFIQKTLNPITIKNSESVKSSLSIVKKNSNSCCEKKVVANKPHRK